MPVRNPVPATLTLEELMEEFRISRRQVNRIINNEAWVA